MELQCLRNGGKYLLVDHLVPFFPENICTTTVRNVGIHVPVDRVTNAEDLII
jgi:hypothetical protein